MDKVDTHACAFHLVTNVGKITSGGWAGMDFSSSQNLCKISVVEMASQKLVETSRLMQSVRWNVQLAPCREITATNLWEFAAVCGLL